MPIRVGIARQQMWTAGHEFLAAGTAEAADDEIHDSEKREHEYLVLKVMESDVGSRQWTLDTGQEGIRARGVALVGWIGQLFLLALRNSLRLPNCAAWEAAKIGC